MEALAVDPELSVKSNVLQVMQVMIYYYYWFYHKKEFEDLCLPKIIAMSLGVVIYFFFLLFIFFLLLTSFWYVWIPTTLFLDFFP